MQSWCVWSNDFWSSVFLRYFLVTTHFPYFMTYFPYFLMSWHIFDVMTYFHDVLYILFDIMKSCLTHIFHTFKVMTNFLTSGRIIIKCCDVLFDVMTYLPYFLTSLRTCWCHDVLLTSWVLSILFDVMTYFLTSKFMESTLLTQKVIIFLNISPILICLSSVFKSHSNQQNMWSQVWMGVNTRW